MVALIPYVRETFRRHLNPKQAVMLIEFDKLKRDYQEHQNEIHSKLIAIMGERLAVHVKSLQQIQWEELSSPPTVANQYVELLVKETVTLHKVLSKYLGGNSAEVSANNLAPYPSPLRFVFGTAYHERSICIDQSSSGGRVSENRIAERGRETTVSLYSIPVLLHSQLPRKVGSQRLEGNANLCQSPLTTLACRMLLDARFLHEKLTALRGASSLSNMLETIVQEKGVKAKSVLYPNGVAASTTKLNGEDQRPSQSPSAAVLSHPLRNGSIDEGARAKSPPPVAAPPTNPLASRPSPFAKRGLVGLGIVGSNNSSLNSVVGSRSVSPGSAPGTGSPSGD